MPHEVRFRPLAEADLAALYRYIAEDAGRNVAERYLDRIESACMSLATLPRRGVPRDDLAPGIRTPNFERRAIIAYRADEKSVVTVPWPWPAPGRRRLRSSRDRRD